MPLPPFKTEELFAFLTDILQTPSPTGYTHLAIERVRAELAALPGLEMRLTRKGSLLVTLAGEESQAPRALTAHVDTLGAMVKEVKANGRLELTNLGGLTWNGVEAEDCTVFTQSGGQIPGSLVPVKASAHVYGKEVTETERSSHNMEMRLDVRTESRQETQDLGIRVGDFVAFDPRVVQRNSYIRARFLDDKSCVACLVTAVKAIRAAGLNPRQTTYLLFSNFEFGVPEFRNIVHAFVGNCGFPKRLFSQTLIGVLHLVIPLCLLLCRENTRLGCHRHAAESSQNRLSCAACCRG